MIIDRWNNIIELLSGNSKLTASELSKVLNISESTIRRDLNKLKSRNIITSINGKNYVIKEYVPLNPINENNLILTRRNFELNKKIRIARFAASLVKDNETIFLGASSTVSPMVEFLTARDILVFTNNSNCVKALTDRGIHTYVCGGYISTGSGSIYSDNYDYLKNMNFNKCFLGSNGISLRGHYNSSSASDIMIKKIILERSEEAYILCDSSKFNHTYFQTFCGLNEAVLITDNKPPFESDEFRYFIADGE